MTRLKLNWCAEQIVGTMPSMSTFKILFILTAVYVVFNWVTNAIIEANDEDGDEYDTSGSENDSVIIVSIAQDLVGLAFGIYTLYLTIKTRMFIRRKYEIPTGCCGSCEGKKRFCALCLCSIPWTAAMAR